MKNFFDNIEDHSRKKYIIVTIILLFLILIFLLVNSKKETDEIEDTFISPKTSTVFYSTDKLESIELSNSLKLKEYNSGLDYILELKSPENLNIFISKNEEMKGKELLQIVNADKELYLQNFSNISNVSDVKELLVGENTAYIYSTHYLDTVLDQAFYLQVIWLQIDNVYYTFDIEFPLDDLSLYTNIATDVLSTFKLNQ